MSLQIWLWDGSSSLAGASTSSFSLPASCGHRVGCRKGKVCLSLSEGAPVLAEISVGLPSQCFSASVLQVLCPGPEALLLPHAPGPTRFHPWPPPCVREGSAAATEASQRKFLPVRAQKVHDGLSCPHFQLCLEVRVPGVVMSAVSACSTGLEKDLSHTGRVFGWVTLRNSA